MGFPSSPKVHQGTLCKLLIFGDCCHQVLEGSGRFPYRGSVGLGEFVVLLFLWLVLVSFEVFYLLLVFTGMGMFERELDLYLIKLNHLSCLSSLCLRFVDFLVDCYLKEVMRIFPISFSLCCSCSL